LKVDKSILDDHQAQLVVEVDSQRVQAARKRAARKLGARGKIPGFRPGKAPFDVIVRYYGEAAVNEQAMDLLVDEVYPEALKSAELEPAAAGSLEKIDDDDPPRFTFKVPLAPEVKLGDYRAYRSPYEFEPPGPERLEQALDELRQVYASTETVERVAAEGDHVIVEIQSELEALRRTDFATIIRASEHPDEFPFPGFAQELIGLEAGGSKTLHHTYPKETANAALAGQDAEIRVTVKTVRSVSLPELDDEFAKMVGKYESLAALKDALAKEVEARARAEYDDEYYAGLVDQLREGAEIKYAPQTLEHEAEHVVNDMGRRLAQQGLDLETYYKIRNTNAAGFLEEEAKPVAKKRLERSLILDEVARAEKVEVDNTALDEEFNSTLLDLQGQGLDLAAVRGGKQGKQRVAEAVAMQSASRLMTRRTLERLRSIATGENPAVGEGGDDSKPAPKSKAKKPARTKTAREKKPARPAKTAAKKPVNKK
jgi:trigger factor